MMLEVEYLPTNAEEAGDSSSVFGLGRFPGVGNGKPTPVFLHGKFHGQGRLVRLQSMRSQKVR